MQKIIAVLLTLTVVLSFPFAQSSVAADTEFSDVSPEDWFYGSVMALTQDGILDGFPDGTFKPDKELTIAQFIKMICVSVLPTWIDVYSVNATLWSDAYYYAALDSGIIRESEFAPDGLESAISRYDAGLLLSRALENVLDEKIDIPAGVSAVISDIDSIPVKYVHSVQLGFASGLLTGYSNGEFRGDNTLTRAQGATLIVRLTNSNMRVKLPSTPTQPAESSLSHKEILTTGGEALFIGDSLTHGLYLYGKLREPDYLYSTGMSVFKATTGKFSASGGTELTLTEALQGKSYKEVYIMFGINELGAYVNDFTTAYGIIIDKVVELIPNAKIYIQSVLPISEEKDKSKDIFTIKKIAEFNDGLKALAADKGATYIDLYSLFSDENGYLPAANTWDGVHLNSKDYVRWSEYLKAL